MNSAMNAQSLQEVLGSMVLGIDHLTIAVRDLQKSIDWYEKTLGFRLLERHTVRGSQTSMRSAVMRVGNVTLVLVEGGEPSSQVSRFIEENGEGVTHIAFAVPDLDAAIHQIRSSDGPATLTPVNDEGIRQVFLERNGQTGVRIELIERKGGTFTDRSMAAMFRVLEERDLY
ncbi:MAG TPA: VOC family protein [Polyangiaceae bacterium]|nr:VOC family protein [Polyangiaceae bacterium]